MKTRNLTGPELDWAVAQASNNAYPQGTVRKIDGRLFIIEPGDHENEDFWRSYSPSADWSEGGPLIELHCICLKISHDGVWLAWIEQNYLDEPQYMQSGATALVAAMRCFVESVAKEQA